MHKLISTTQLSPFHAVARDDSPYIVGRKLRNEVFDVFPLLNWRRNAMKMLWCNLSHYKEL